MVLAQPSYASYVPDIMFADGVPVFVPTHPDGGWQLDPEAVEAAITPRTKVLFLGYPCNPTGAVLEPDIIRALAGIAERHDLLVISDEIYDRLVYGGHRHEAFSALPGMKERTVLFGGFSKAYAMTGWRVGYACAPRDLLDGIMKVHQYVITSAPTTAQDAAVVALERCETDVARMVAEYDRRRRMFVAGLERIGLPTVEPRGAFYAFPDIRRSGLSSDEFCDRLLHEANVAVVPGTAFGPSGEGYVRATLATSVEDLEEAIVRIERFLATLDGRDGSPRRGHLRAGHRHRDPRPTAHRIEDVLWLFERHQRGGAQRQQPPGLPGPARGAAGDQPGGRAPRAGRGHRP